MANDRIIPPLEAGKQFRGFSLHVSPVGISLLPDEHELVVNAESGQFVLFNWSWRYVVADGKFTAEELPLMVALLNAWPSFVPCETLLQRVTGRPLDEVAELFEIAPVAAAEPLRVIVDGCQDRLRGFGVEIANVNGHGYKLSRYRDKKE